MTTDWLMVIITAIYVIATCFICWANIKSANASKSQLEESKRQYEDKKRLEIVPYIQFEETTEKFGHEINLVLNSGDKLTGKYALAIRMKNIGNGTAKDIAYTYQWDNYIKNYNRGPFPVQALSSGESQIIVFKFAYAPNGGAGETACLILRYKDLLENEYTQRLKIGFKYNDPLTLRLVELATSSPVLGIEEGTNA